MAPRDPETSTRGVFFDTPDRRLARFGVSLWHEDNDKDVEGDGEAPWTAELPAPWLEGGSSTAVSRPGRRDNAPRDLRDLLAAFTRAGELVEVSSPKASAVTPAPPEPSPDDPAGVAVGSALSDGVARLVTNDPGVRLGEDEGIHKMRVAARRLRSDLRTFRPLLSEGWASPLVMDLQGLARGLGRARDCDVLIALLREHSVGLEDKLQVLFEALDRRRDEARSELLDELRAPRFSALIDSLMHAAAEPALTAEAERPCHEVLPGLVSARWRKLEEAATSLEPGAPDDDYHRVRIEAKKVRYAAEAVAPALGKRGSDAADFAAGVASVQDVLGNLQDAAVGMRVVEDLARSRSRSGALNLASGRLIERLAIAAGEARGDWPKAWKRASKRKRRRWLEA